MKQLRRILGLAIWASLVITPVAADDSLSDIRKLLTKKPLICADFTQQKFVRALTRPLVSKGRLIFVAEKGVLWKVREPFSTKILVKSDALIKWDDEGVPQRISFGQTPVFRAFSRVFLAVFSGDINQLQQTFEFDSNVSQLRWQLTLIPREPGFATIIKTIRVSGGQFVEELVIEEGRGDKTLIQFSRMNADTCQLDKVEKGNFAQ